MRSLCNKALNSKTGPLQEQKASALYSAWNVTCLQLQPLRRDPICDSAPSSFHEAFMQEWGLFFHSSDGWPCARWLSNTGWWCETLRDSLTTVVCIDDVCVFLFFAMLSCFLFFFLSYCSELCPTIQCTLPSVAAAFHFYNAILIVFVALEAKCKIHVRIGR